jgi:hypothetical protein
MHHVDDWPWPVRAHLRRAYGELSGVDRLGGMSLGRVYRVHFPDGSVIVKTSPQPTEALFYERVAGRLRQAGIPIPALKWSCHLPDWHWLILEDIPPPAPRPASHPLAAGPAGRGGARPPPSGDARWGVGLPRVAGPRLGRPRHRRGAHLLPVRRGRRAGAMLPGAPARSEPPG